MNTTEYRLTDLAVTNIRASVPLMSKLMERFDRRQRTIEKMLDVKDIRLADPEVIDMIIEVTGLYREQIIEEVVAAA